METWILVMAMYAGGTVTNYLSLPSTLGPMPSLDVCLDVAQSMERAGKGRIMAGCSIIITDNATTATTGDELQIAEHLNGWGNKATQQSGLAKHIAQVIRDQPR